MMNDSWKRRRALQRFLQFQRPNAPLLRRRAAATNEENLSRLRPEFAASSRQKTVCDEFCLAGNEYLPVRDEWNRELHGIIHGVTTPSLSRIV